MMAMHKINDCYFYYYSKCSKGDACPFRHEPAALGSEIVCHRWKQGKCYNMNCIHRHMDIQKNRSREPCYWETQPGGCRKPHCAFLHRFTRDLNEMPDSSGHLDIPAYDILGVTSRESGVQSSAFGVSQRLSCENIGNVIASETQSASPKVNQLVITANDEESDQESSNGNTPVKMQRVTYDLPKKITLRKSDQNIQDNAALGIMTLEDIKRERAIRSFVQNKIASEQVSNKAVAVLSDSKPKTHLSSGRTIVLAPGQTSETSQDTRNLPAASGQRSSIKARLGLHSNSSGKDASVDEKPTSVKSQLKRQRSDGNGKLRSNVSDSKLGIKTLFEIKQEKERLLAVEENKTGSGGIESKGGTVKTSGGEHDPRQEASQRKRRSLELYRPRGTSATTAGKDEAQSASSVIKTGKSSVKPGSADEKASGSSWTGVKTLAEIMREKRLKAAATACEEDPSSSGGSVKIMQSELKTVGSTTSTHTDDLSSQPDLEKAAKRKFTPIVFDLDVKENKSANIRVKVADRTRMSELKSGSGELIAEDQQAVKEPAPAAALKSAKSQSAASLCAMSEELSENSSASPACDSSNDANQTVQSLHVPSLVSSSTNQLVVSLPDVCDSSNQKPLVVLKRQHSSELHSSDHTAAKRGLLSPALGSPKEGPTDVTSKLPTGDDDLLSNQLDDLIDEIGVDILPAAKTVAVDQLNEDDLLLEMQELLS